MTINSEKWIQSLPNEWSITKIGSHFKCRNEKVNDTDYPPLSVAKQGVVPQIETVAKTDANDNRKLVLMDDFVINSRSDRKESCGLSKLNGSVSLINHVLYQNDQDYYMPFVGILFKNYGFAEEFYRWGHGIVADLWTTRWQEMKNIEIPLPPLKEQKLIFDFLTNRTSKINQLISNQEKQIEKLKEYRQAIITKAVTKGLDPNAPMKDSGVEWIGNIPCNWETLKLKYCFSVRNEKYENGNYDYVALENVEPFSGKYKATESNAFYSLAETIRANRNDVIFGKLRPYLSKAFLIAKDCYVSSEFAVLYGLGGNRTSFLKYLLISSKFIDVINSSTYGTKMPRANIDFIRNLEIAIPDVKTQKEIVNYLDEACIKIDRLIDVKVRKIAQLSNYKRSLIYEYVTGKKRVSL